MCKRFDVHPLMFPYYAALLNRLSNDLEESKRMALYYLANLMFRIYFKVSVCSTHAVQLYSATFL